MVRNEPLWFKDAIIYELHVRSFHDVLGDGVGDFPGLTQKLDYLQDLGVTALWLLPFYPSPLKDDGYDIADYTNINPDYGTLDSFREFLEGAHSRGMRVITELVINHTSDRHPWFQRARRAPPGSVARDFYVWSDTPECYQDARIIFKDFETSNWTYDHVAKAYFWHRFYSHQPDLNYDNPAVRQAILPLIDFWLDMGVDGLRLDAVPYLFEREGTNCENLPETHAYLKELRRHVESRYPDRMLLAEANQWPEDAAAYFGDGDECHMAFHFPVMPRLYMAMHTEDRFPLVDILQQTPHIPANCQWAIFLRNHDELTLEMVTDEERDYMYRAYAQDRQARINLGIRRRLAPLMGNNRRQIELMNGLLFSLPGTPVLYYGDEIGMGDNIYLGDRNGVRTPMQWSADRNAGFSRANPQRLFLPIIIDPEYHYEAVNVEAQQANASSLLWWNKRLISLRQQHRAFSRGDITFLDPHNRKILAFLRCYEDECVLVVANLSRFFQYVELDLSQFEGMIPIEMFGSTSFPRIGRLPYLLTLGPHAFYWFSLSQIPGGETRISNAQRATHLPAVNFLRSWDQLFERSKSRLLLDILRTYLQNNQVPAGDNRRHVRNVNIRDSFWFSRQETNIRLLLVDVEYNTGEPETIVLRMSFAAEEVVASWPAGTEPALFARLTGDSPGVIYNAAAEPSLLQGAFSAMLNQSTARGELGGELVAWSSAVLRSAVSQPGDVLPLAVTRTEQNNQSVTFGGRWVLKMLRRVDQGLHPEVELGRLFTEPQDPLLAPRLLGGIEYRSRRAESMTLALLHEFVPNESDAWQYTLDVVSHFFERMAAIPTPPPQLPMRLVADSFPEIPAYATEGIPDYLENVGRLGTRLGELHRFLGSQHDPPDLAAEPFTMQYQRSLYQSMRGQTLDMIDLLERTVAELPEELQRLAQQVLTQETELRNRYRPLLERPFHSQRIRCHGDCHLGQVLFTGKDFVFIDFEGIPALSLGERRIKRCPLRDVVGMLNSFEYAAQSALLGLSTGRGQAQGVIRSSDRAMLQLWAEFWRLTVSRRFLEAYLAVPRIHDLIPSRLTDLQQLLDILMQSHLTTAITEEIRHRPPWAQIPMNSLLRLITPVTASA